MFPNPHYVFPGKDNRGVLSIIPACYLVEQLKNNVAEHGVIYMGIKFYDPDSRIEFSLQGLGKRY